MGSTDPSFKQYSFEEGLDIKEIGVSDEQIIEAFKVNGDDLLKMVQ